MRLGSMMMSIGRYAGLAAADGPFGNHATLADDLVSYWALDETSGSRADSVGSNTLTDNNTVLYDNTGPQGVTAKFTGANIESLQANPGVGVLTGDFTIAGWINCDNKTNYSSNTGAGWFCSLPGSDISGSVICAVRSSGVLTVRYWTADLTNSMIVTTSTFSGWHYVVVRRTSGTVTIWVDGVSEATGAGGVEAGWGAHHTKIGSAYAAEANSFNDKISRVGVWSATSVSDAVVISLYNNGVGKAYADMSAAETTGLSHFWNLTESSGSRSASVGDLTLTDNNTVTSVDNTHPNFGKAASFVAANSEYLSRPSSDANLEFDVASDATFAAWVKPEIGVATYKVIISKVNAGSAMNFNLRLFNNTVEQIYWHEAGPAQGLTEITNWALVIGWKEGTDLKIQTNDGTIVTAAIVPSARAQNTGMTIGSSAGGTHFFGGLMGHVMVWSRALTAQERTDLYNAGAGLFYGD